MNRSSEVLTHFFFSPRGAGEHDRRGREGVARTDGAGVSEWAGWHDWKRGRRELGQALGKQAR